MKNLNRFSSLFDLTGRIAIVTGAAQGNGMGIANALSDAGAKTIATDIAYADKCLLKEDIERMVMDVTDENIVKRTMEKVIEKYKKIDILINNAGVIYKSPIESIEIERFKKVMDVNLNGTVICTKTVVPYMKENEWGRIVNVSSSQAFLCSEEYSAYSASKSAISHLTRIWGNELAKHNIFINAICPSYVMTPMMENSIKRLADALCITEQEATNSYLSDIPQKRILTIEEVANWVVVLCSKLTNSTTGNNFSITGGQVKL